MEIANPERENNGVMINRTPKRTRWCDACFVPLEPTVASSVRHCPRCSRLLDVMAVSCLEP